MVAYETPSEIEFLGFVLAAVHAVVPRTNELTFRSRAHMWHWVVNESPVGAALLADLTPEQRGLVRIVLDGMLREGPASGSPSPTQLTVEPQQA